MERYRQVKAFNVAQLEIKEFDVHRHDISKVKHKWNDVNMYEYKNTNR